MRSPAIALASLLALGTASCKLPSCARHSPPPPDAETSAPAPTRTEGWSVAPTEDATVELRFNHARLVESEYMFFGPKWAWAGPKVELGAPADGRQPFQIEVQSLGLHIDGEIRPVDEHTLRLSYTMKAEQTRRGVEGGGLEFRLRSHPTLSTRGAELLEDEGGFRWNVGDAAPLRVHTRGQIDDVYFERKDEHRVRVFFFRGDIEAGTHEASIDIELPGDGQILAPVAERFGMLSDAWHPATLSWRDWPIDLSFLNDGHRPAGRHGPIVVQGDRLTFQDGTPARLWGTNIAAFTIFSGSKEDVQRQAQRLAAFGFNLVRIHHHDSAWVRPNVFGDRPSTTRSLDDASLKRLDWWVKCLQDQGIYVWLDLHVGRAFTPGDAIEGDADLRAQRGEGKAFNYVNERIEQLMNEFARSYLERTNAFTGRKYVDDPGIVALLVTNENDITHHGGRALIPQSGAAHHARLATERAKAFAAEHDLPAREVENFAKPGPAKIFLNDLEAGFAMRSMAKLRTLGVTRPLATTNFWGKDPLFALPALTVGDLIDVHSYGERGFLAINPLVDPNFLAWAASGRVSGMPLAMSEWNVAYPARDRHAAPMYVAAISAFQEWDAPMFYVYSQSPIQEPRRVDAWTSWHDPGLMAPMPAAALAFRRGDVSPGHKLVVLSLDRKSLYETMGSAANVTAIRTAFERHRFAIALPDVEELEWDRASKVPDDAVVIRDVGHSFLPPDATEVTSDTGQLRRDWSQGMMSIDSPRTQSVAGWLQGTLHQTKAATFESQTPSATLALTSLDEQPLERSRRILLTAVSQVAAKPADRVPLRAQPVEARIRLRTEHAHWDFIPLYADGKRTRGPATRLQASGGELLVELKGPDTHWFELRAAPAEDGASRAGSP